MVEDAAKPFHSNITASDVFVPVDMRIQLGFGVVGVDDLDVVEAQNLVDLRHRLLDGGRCREIVSRCQAVASVDAEADFELG